MRLDIGGIANHNLRTAGKNDALTALILRGAEDVVGALDIVIQERGVEFGVRIGVGREVNHDLDVLTGLLTSIQISNIKEAHLMVLAHLPSQSTDLPIS